MGILILTISIFGVILVGVSARITGKNPFIWVALSLVIILIVGLSSFSIMQEFYPCHPEECTPIIGALIGLSTPFLVVLWIFLIRNNPKW
jgi:hypothetical protein